MNEYIVRCYFLLTKLVTSKTPYSKNLHRLVLEKIPNMRSKSIQNILDRKSSICTVNRLPVENIIRIKHKVSVEIGFTLNSEEPAEEETTEEIVQTPLNAAEIEFDRIH